MDSQRNGVQKFSMFKKKSILSETNSEFSIAELLFSKKIKLGVLAKGNLQPVLIISAT